jgi:hypothetical protein
MIAVADAPAPPPPTIDTRGDEVYPAPPLVTVISLREPLTTTDAAAPVPPPPLTVIAGGNAASYPVPALLIVTEVTAPKVLVILDL